MVMSYNNALEKAYRTIFLHDCEIKRITYEEGNFCIYFPGGFFFEDAETRTEGCAEIEIKTDFSNDGKFIVSKPHRLFKGMLPFYITTHKSLKDIEKMLDKGYCFTILDEYYKFNEYHENGVVFWKGVIEQSKRGVTKEYGYFEFTFDCSNLTYRFNVPN